MYHKNTILCDADGILVAMLEGWLKAIESDHGVKATVGEIDQWSLHKCAPLKTLTPDQVYAYLEKPGFWLGLEPLPGALEGLKSLVEDGHKVVILTSAGSGICAKEKREWFLRHCPFLPKNNIIIIGEMDQKMMVRGDYIIDDNPDVLNKWVRSASSWAALGIQYPYNEHSVSWDSHDILKMGSYLDTATAWKNIVEHIRKETRKP